MLVSQYWGRGDRKSILTIMGISLQLSVGVTVLVTLLCFFCPAAIMRIFTNDAELIAIGAGEMKEAKKNASRICKITLLFGAVTAVLILASRPLIFMAIQLTDTAYQYLDVMLWISSYYVIGQAINTTVITGVFRAGGDSRFGFLCDTITMWVISVPLGFLSAFVFCLPPLWVYFILCLDEFWKIPAVYKHYKSYKWLQNITRDFSDTPSAS